VNSRGVALYTLSGATKSHFKCASSLCFGFWPPMKVHSAHAKLTKGPGVKGKLGIVHRSGFFQVTLNGHPLYMFSVDKGRKGIAMGEGVVSFGGTWHVVKGSSAGASSGGGGSTGTTVGSPTGTTMPPYPYP
jgi:predicted lipoprotein with Yx(FWY)xxD motif